MVVTPDDFLRLNERAFTGQARIGARYALIVFEKLVRQIEPHIVITDSGGATDWLAQVELARAQLAAASSYSGRDAAALVELAQIAARYWKLEGPYPQRKLDFIRAPDLRRVAEEDWTRLVAAAQREDAKTTAIAAGSVVEAVALDLLGRTISLRPPARSDPRPGCRSGRSGSAAGGPVPGARR